MAARQLRRSSPPDALPEPVAGAAGGRVWLSALVTAVVVAGAVTGGWAMGRATTPTPAGTLAGCRTQAEIAPRHYAGPPRLCIDVHHKYLAEVDTTKGRIGILLDPALAPGTVNNFIVLAVNGYYNGLEFFRAESWVLQTGDPLENGHGGPGYTLPPEGKPGHLVADAVGMARVSGGPINGSQFFILVGTWPGGGPGSTIYNRFGAVLQGLGLLSSLGKGDRILDIHVKRA